jgi:glc operon protein GlcG
MLRVYPHFHSLHHENQSRPPNLDALLEGGVPIIKDGQCLGAVGVSGVKSNEDAQIAKAGIAAIGL